MIRYKKIGFIGLGLIGGSIAKAIREKHPSVRLYARAGSAGTVAEAFHAGVIENEAPMELSDFAQMDVIFLCSPVGINIEYLNALSKIVPETTLITDVGSVKSEIVNAAAAAGLSRQFIGGHPMTGSENSGFSSADPLLLENAYYILCAGEGVEPAVVSHFSAFITSLGADTLRLEPGEHDHAVAAISHLPHIIASSLVNLVRESDNDGHVMRMIAAGGFKDLTRIASSSPVMWQNICIENKAEILSVIDLYADALDRSRKLVEKGDTDGLLSFFGDAKDYRDSMPIRAKGLLPAAFDFYLDLKDEAGQISIVAAILAAAQLNIKNIGIVHNREFSDGVLHIDMYDGDSMNTAMELLQQHGYRLYRH